MSRGRGEFGYGSTVQEYHDSPVRPYRDYPDFGGAAASHQARSAIPQGKNFSVLSDSISSNIFNISSSATTLERAFKQLGTNKDSIELRNKIHDTEKKTNEVITDTAAYFKQLSAICSRADRTQKLQMDRLMGEFREVTEKYHSFQKKVAERVRTSKPVQSSIRPSAAPELIGWNETDDDDRTYLVEQRKKQILMQKESVDVEVALLQEREEQIQQLESDILNINDIFRELGTLVHDQGDVIDSIEQNVESAHSNVESGTEQLQRAATYQAKARKKKLCIIGIVLIIAAIIVIIIVVSVKAKK